MHGNKLMIIMVLGLIAAIVGMTALPSEAQQTKTRVYTDSAGKPIAVEAWDPSTGQEVTNYTYKASDGSVVPHVSELDPAMQALLKKSVEKPQKAPESAAGTTAAAPRRSEGHFTPYTSKANGGGTATLQEYRCETWRRVHAEGARRLARRGPRIPLSRSGLYPVSALTGIQP